ncbi:hypothetical protein FDP41_003739 [Naegleria fowleri]|uniref:Uncharacterized protein n=1 Tax=Naegleria fowleri TaxID=5763 RepID=A0A6A5BPW7_NAEFO|nr:uncharacterized protein FDP41_003739 [Naegleria fowleri]KAF0977086.1 hypothetical protein FDP41_003739 [Naegleria fowleri]CAG4717630.1 unnamed protein product [Naegleria fowleri]
MTQSKHQIILLNGEMASGKSTTLQFLVRKLQQDSSGGDYGTSTKTIDFVGFIQPSVFAWDNKPPCTNTSKTTDTSCSNHSLESLVLNETHRKAIEIHFIDSSKEGSQIFTLATLNPEFKSLDHEPSSNMIKVMEENIKSKRPQQPRWLFNNEVFEKIKTLMLSSMEHLTRNASNSKSGERKIVVMVDELGWLEMEGKGHWPTVELLLSQYGKLENIVWGFTVRSTLREDHTQRMKQTFKNCANICEDELDLHIFELKKSNPTQEKADNFDQVLEQVLACIKKSE